MQWGTPMPVGFPMHNSKIDCFSGCMVLEITSGDPGSELSSSSAPPPLAQAPGRSGKRRSDRFPVLGQGGACTPHAVPQETYVTENLPIPHPQHNCRNRALEHNVQTNFSKFWRSSLPIRGIRSCGIEALSDLAPHLEQLHMLAIWGRLWNGLGFRFWNGVRLPIPWAKTVSNNIFGEANLPLKPRPFLMYFE